MPINSSIISVDATDNGKTYALGGDITEVRMDTTLTDGFKIRFVKTSQPNVSIPIHSELGFRGIDNTLFHDDGPIALVEPNDSIEFMFDAQNNCWQIVATRQSGLELRLNEITNQVTAVEAEVDVIQAAVVELQKVSPTVLPEYTYTALSYGGRATFDLRLSKTFVVNVDKNITHIRFIGGVTDKVNECRVLFVNGSTARTINTVGSKKSTVHRQKGASEIASLGANDVLLMDFTSNDNKNWYPRKVAEWNPSALIDTTTVAGAPVIKSVTPTVYAERHRVTPINMPPSVSNGDLLIITLCSPGQPYVQAPLPPGWSKVAPENYASGIIQFYKIGTTADSGTTLWHNTGVENGTVSYVHCIQAGTFKTLRTGAILPVFTRVKSSAVTNIDWSSFYGAGPHQLLAFGATYGSAHVVSHALAQNQDVHWPTENNEFDTVTGSVMGTSSMPVTGEAHAVAPYVMTDYESEPGWTTRLLAVPGVNATVPSQPELFYHREGFMTGLKVKVNAPEAPIVEGDLMVLGVAINTLGLSSVPTGWTQLGTSGTFQAWFYKVATASEPETITFANTYTNASAYYNLYVFAAGTYDTAVAPIFARASGTSTTIAPPTGTAPTVGRHFVIAAETHGMDWAYDPVPTAMALSSHSHKFYNNFFYSMQSNTGVNFGQAWGLLTGSTSIVPGNFTIKNSMTWDAVTVLIKSK